MDLLRQHFPLKLLIYSLNSRYSKRELEAFLSPWPEKKHRGGTTSFPLLVPVVPPSHRLTTNNGLWSGTCLSLPPWGSDHVGYPDFPGHLDSSNPSSLFRIGSPTFRAVRRLCGTFFQVFLTNAENHAQVGNRPLFYDSLIPGVKRLKRVPKSGHLVIGVNDTLVFLLNEYIVELNPANFNILNQILNWIFLKFFKLNNFLNLIFLNWIIFWIEFCPNFPFWIFYGIEFCPEISYWIESGWKTENQLYFESILWYYTLKYPKNTPKCLIMP